MIEVRVHGRGGQGIAATMNLMAAAASVEGYYARAWAQVIPERSGIPAVAYCRISDGPIRSREPVLSPSCVIVADAALTVSRRPLAGLRPHGFLLVNAAQPPMGWTDWAARSGHRLASVPATRLMLTHVGRPTPGPALLGAFAALTGRLGLPSVVEAIDRLMPARITDGSVRAAQDAYYRVRVHEMADGRA